MPKKHRRSLIVQSSNFYAPLSNDSPFPFVVDSVYFSTFTHYYFYVMTNDDKGLQANVLKCTSVKMIHELVGSIIYNRLINCEDIVKYYHSNTLFNLLYNGIVQKFKQNPIVKMLARRTGDAHLNFDCGIDPYLGIGPDSSGLNVMGVLTMFVRAKFKFKGFDTINYAQAKFHKLKLQIRLMELSRDTLKLESIQEVEECD